MLDQAQQFIDDYHVIGFGAGFIAAAIVITLLFKSINGMWRWHKQRITH